ncbi:MAG TPA: DUF1684 domain-containing protein [Bryobacteraceae bacterium]|nr:DUF1684 domain-containing protein [Bryobacteraceae bacterium]
MLKLRPAVLLASVLLTPVLSRAADASASVDSKSGASSPAAYAASIAQWRAGEEAQLKADDGWLTVVGLTWIKSGESRVGSNASSEVVLPKSAPERVGTLTLANGKVRFKPAPGLVPGAVTINGQPARETELKPDIDATYTRVVVGRVKFFIIKREDKFGVRIKDNDSAARREFTGLRWFAVDPSWRVTAQYVPFDKPRELTFETLVGVKERDESPGYVRFERNGKEFRMDPTVDGNTLWFVMRDATSGRTTYAASRFLYAELPKNGLKQPGPVVIDFNKAENPPCVFTPYATCPLPPPQNRLTLAVTAGEQMYGAHH